MSVTLGVQLARVPTGRPINRALPRQVAAVRAGSCLPTITWFGTQRIMTERWRGNMLAVKSSCEVKQDMVKPQEYLRTMKKSHHEKCCGRIGHLMQFNALFGHKKSIPMGQPRRQKTRDPRSWVFFYGM
jgi:hypothetical protein